MIESDKEELLYTFYLLVSSCQEFHQKTLPSLYMTAFYTYDLSDLMGPFSCVRKCVTNYSLIISLLNVFLFEKYIC